ncbi:FBP domain-containing protein [Allokutzneria oryzae]|uniref:FBP domain-containing protein n=1 Tax=Allokutzneria oryzae TaxID=1378989 RepID=A0ABV5ZUG0_9PSEU
MEPLSQAEIRSSFVNCSKGEAKGVTLPARVETIPWADIDFLGWRDPKATGRGYLVLRHEGAAVGLSLRATTPPRSRLRSSLCNFCMTAHAAADIALFSARRAGAAGKAGNTLGVYLCADLACCLYVRRKLVPEVPQPSETLSVEERVARMELNLHRFVADVLSAP